MEAITFERDIDEYESHIAVIDSILSGERRISVVLSSTSANKRKLVYFQQEVFGFVKIQN